MYSIMCVYMHHICIYNVYVYIFVVYFTPFFLFANFRLNVHIYITIVMF